MNNSVKKYLDIAFKVISCLIIVFTLGMVIFTVVSVSTLDKNDRPIFGTKFYIVKTDSMSLSDKNADMEVHFDAGDIIMVREPENRYELKAGDVIAFISTNGESYGETVTHMIHEVRRNTEGEVEYVTFGTNTGTVDEEPVDPDYVLGVYSGKLPWVGRFFAFVKSPVGYITCILLPFLLLIVYNGVNVIRLFRKYKAEQNAEIEAERAAIALEREQNAEMLRELIALKEQLAKSGEKENDE